MALHNYIYNKHPDNVLVDGKIARKHDPRPISIKVHGDQMQNSEIVQEEKLDNPMYITQRSSCESIRSTYEMELLNELDNDGDSSESNHASRAQSHGNGDHQNSHHPHLYIPSHALDETNMDDQFAVNEKTLPSTDSLLVTTPIATKCAPPGGKVAPKAFKWVVIDGKKRKLRSRVKSSTTRPKSPK